MRKFRNLLVLLIFTLLLLGCNIFEKEAEYVYEGDLVNGYAQGQGVIYDGDKIIFEGNFEDGVLEGEGIYYENELPKYEGEFKDGVPLGNGKYFKEGNMLFEGEIVSNDGDEMTLDGILYNENEEPFFSGEVKIIGDEIIFPDYGKLLNPDGSVFYEGELEDGMPKNE